jgi:hypothetical protein
MPKNKTIRKIIDKLNAPVDKSNRPTTYGAAARAELLQTLLVKHKAIKKGWELIEHTDFYKTDPRYQNLRQIYQKENQHEKQDSFLFELLFLGPIFSTELNLRGCLIKAFEYNQTDLIELLKQRYPHQIEDALLPEEKGHIEQNMECRGVSWRAVQYILKWPGAISPSRNELRQIVDYAKNYHNFHILDQFLNLPQDARAHAELSIGDLFVFSSSENNIQIMNYLFNKFKDDLNPSTTALALATAVQRKQAKSIDFLVKLPEPLWPTPKDLKKILSESAKVHFETIDVFSHPACTDQLISEAYQDAAAANEWGVIDSFTSTHFIYPRLTDDAINNVAILMARSQQWENLLRWFSNKELAKKISAPTVETILLLDNYSLPDNRHACAFIQALIRNASNRPREEWPNASVIKVAHIKTIEAGQVEVVNTFKELPSDCQPDIESVVEALKVAAGAKRYEIVIATIHQVPEPLRLEILKIKTNDGNALDWACSKNAREDITNILHSLNEAERFQLITEASDTHGCYSPLMNASGFYNANALTYLLNSVSHPLQRSAILPKKITLNTPLYSPKSDCLAVLLTILFGENQRLHEAYHALDSQQLGFEILDGLRDSYLAAYYPNALQQHNRQPPLRYLIREFKITLQDEEELKLVACVVFFRHYSRYDHIQRERLESQIDKMYPEVQTGSIEAPIDEQHQAPDAEINNIEYPIIDQPQTTGYQNYWFIFECLTALTSVALLIVGLTIAQSAIIVAGAGLATIAVGVLLNNYCGFFRTPITTEPPITTTEPQSLIPMLGQ